jgi:hypothetical protein
VPRFDVWNFNNMYDGNYPITVAEAELYNTLDANDISFNFEPPRPTQQHWTVAGTGLVDGRIHRMELDLEEAGYYAEGPDNYTAARVLEIAQNFENMREIMPRRNELLRSVRDDSIVPDEYASIGPQRYRDIFEASRRTGNRARMSQHLMGYSADIIVDDFNATREHMLDSTTYGALGAAYANAHDNLMRRFITEGEREMPTETANQAPFHGTWADLMTDTPDFILPIDAPAARYPANIVDPQVRQIITETYSLIRGDAEALRTSVQEMNRWCLRHMPKQEHVFIWGKDRRLMGTYVNHIMFFDEYDSAYKMLKISENSIMALRNAESIYILEMMKNNRIHVTEKDYQLCRKFFLRAFQRQHQSSNRARQRYNRIQDDQGVYYRNRQIDTARLALRGRSRRTRLENSAAAFRTAGFNVNFSNEGNTMTLEKHFNGYQFMDLYFVPIQVTMTLKYLIAENSVSMKARADFPSNHWHPHVDSSGDVCLGSFPDEIRRCIDECDPDYLSDQMLLILNNFNAESPFRPLSECSMGMLQVKSTGQFIPLSQTESFYDDDNEDEDEDSDEDY